MFQLQALDPRVRIMMMLCLSTYAMAVENLTGLTSALLFTVLILILGGNEIRRLFLQARLAVGMVLFILIIQCIFVRTGTAVFFVSVFLW